MYFKNNSIVVTHVTDCCIIACNIACNIACVVLHVAAAPHHHLLMDSDLRGAVNYNWTYNYGHNTDVEKWNCITKEKKEKKERIEPKH